MQNPLTALLPNVTLTEAVSPTVPSGVGDGSFTETFAETGSTSEPTAEAKEAAGLELMVPPNWGGFLLAKVAPTPETDLSSTSEVEPLPTEVGTEVVQDTTLPANVESALISSVPLSVPIPGVELPVSLNEGSSIEAPAQQADLIPGFPKAEEQRPGADKARPGQAAVAPVPGGSNSEAGLSTNAISPDQWTVYQFESPTTASFDTRRPNATSHDTVLPDGARQADDHAVERGRPAALPVGAIDINSLPVAVVDKVGGPAHQDEPTDVQAGPPVLGSANLQFVVADTAIHHPTEALSGSEGAVGPNEQSLVDRAVPPHAPKAAAPMVALPEPEPSLPDRSAAPASDQGSAIETVFSSFWESVFSDRTSSMLPAFRSLPVASLAVTVPIPGSAKIDVGKTGTSDPDRNPDSPAAPLAAIQSPELPPGPALPPPAAWSRGVLSDLMSKTLPQLAFAEWSGDMTLSDQPLEFSLSSIAAQSAGPLQGSPTATAVGSHFPAPQIATQLAGALVRSQSGTTELALAPEELGRIRLRIEPDLTNPERLVILISVERPETLDLFRRHAGDLAEAIRSAGYSGADINFGQNSQDDRSGHRKDTFFAGQGIPFEDIGPVETARMHILGATLDLRL
jgi:hypothetical protein